MFPYIGNVIIPTDELIFFRGVGSTTNQKSKTQLFPLWDNYQALWGAGATLFCVPACLEMFGELSGSSSSWSTLKKGTLGVNMASWEFCYGPRRFSSLGRKHIHKCHKWWIFYSIFHCHLWLPEGSESYVLSAQKIFGFHSSGRRGNLDVPDEEQTFHKMPKSFKKDLSGQYPVDRDFVMFCRDHRH